MNKLHFYRWLTMVLLVCNIGLLVFLAVNKPNHPPQPREVVIQKLQLDPQQVEEYEVLIREHQTSIRRIDASIRKAKKSLYEQLKSDDQPALRDSLIAEITALQTEVEKVHYQHFEDIRSLCKPQQLERFNALTEELARLFAPRPPKRR